MGLRIAIAAALLLFGVQGAKAAAPLNNPALLNIGFVCKWSSRCIQRQEKAMHKSLRYVRKTRPPRWKIQACNRNASRGPSRVDWIGYHNCITNSKLRPARNR